MITTLLAAMQVAAAAQQGANIAQPTILVILAHPDDESVLSPILARATRQHARVVLAYATDGELGVRAGATPIHNYRAGGELADVRGREAVCAANALGADPPIRFRLANEGLTARANLPQLERDVRRVVDSVAPDVVFSWGPDGGYGHQDHRIVGTVVTQVLQADPRPRNRTTPIELYYPEFDAERVRTVNPDFLKALPLSPTAAEYIDARVPFIEDDFQAGTRALQCHVTQYLPSESNAVLSLLRYVYADGVTLQAAFHSGPQLARFFPDQRRSR